MASLEERYQAGLETRRKFGGGTVGSGSVPGSNEMAPDLHRIAAEALFWLDMAAPRIGYGAPGNVNSVSAMRAPA